MSNLHQARGFVRQRALSRATLYQMQGPVHEIAVIQGVHYWICTKCGNLEKVEGGL